MITFLICAVVLIFGLIVFFGAPYVPTFKRQSEIALDLLDLKPGQTLIELGSGDGRVASLAAKKGLKVVGYELNPVLVLVSLIVTFKHRKKVKIIWGNYWNKNWPDADGIFVFLIGKYMRKLDKKINHYPNKPIKLASFAFQIPGKKHEEERSGVFLYVYK